MLVINVTRIPTLADQLMFQNSLKVFENGNTSLIHKRSIRL